MPRIATVIAVSLAALCLTRMIHGKIQRVCAPSPGGDPAGQTADDRGSDGQLVLSHNYIMPEFGTINCQGMIRQWVFFKYESVGCGAFTFHVWRPDDPDDPTSRHTLVGLNDYEETDCGENETTIVFGIPGNEQIPVYPGDVIGWSQTGGAPGFLSHANGTVNLRQKDPPPHNLGVSEPFEEGPAVDVSLHVVIVRGDPPVFGSLPRQRTASWDVGIDFTYDLIAEHPANVLPQLADTAIEDAVELTYALPDSVSDFEIDCVPPPLLTDCTSGGYIVRSCPVHGFRVGDVHHLAVTVTGLGVTTTSTLTVTITNTSSVIKILVPNDDIQLSALDKKRDDEVVTVHFTGANDPSAVRLYLDHGSSDTPTPAHLPPFSIDHVTGKISCSMDLKQLVNTTATQTYNVVVLAFDGGRNDSKNLAITVTDLRQELAIRNLPQTLDVEFREDFNSTEAIFRVIAESAFPEDVLTFTITRVTNYGRDAFFIDSHTGDVYVTEDHSLQPDEYNISISVTDGYYPATNETLTVLVTPLADLPMFDPDVYYVTMPEKCGEVWTGECESLPWTILHLNITPDNGCQPYEGFASYYVGIDSCSIHVKTNIDVDTKPELQTINMTVRTVTTDTDAGSVGATATVFITVEDINDNAPVIEACNFSHQVYENTMGGLGLLMVNATDGDLTSPNNLITFSLLNDDDNGTGTMYFGIDPVTGLIITKQPVDFEVIRQVEFLVLASDGGLDPQRNSTCAVNITIIDVNDNHPVFQCLGRPEDEPYPPDQDCFYNLDLRDDTVLGHEVVRLISTDVDTVTPDTFFFLLVPDETFLLQTDDGRVLVKREVDSYYKYLLYCYSHDKGEPDLLSQVQYIRLDTYPPRWHHIDITLDMPMASFNLSHIKRQFTQKLRTLLNPWHVQLESVWMDEGKTVATVYAISDDSTFYINNMTQEKVFVHRDDMLRKLRKNIHGTPSDDLLGGDFSDYLPIRVMPSYPIWWLDTVEGIATICALCLLFCLILLAIALCICWRKQLLCFKKKPRMKKWKKQEIHPDKPPEIPNYTELKDSPVIKPKSSTAARTPRLSRNPSLASIDTIHTMVYNRK